MSNEACGAPAWNGPRKISLERGIHFSPKLFISFAQSASLYCEQYVYINISDCIQNVYELPLLPNNTATETFLHKSGEVRNVYWIFITVASAWRWLGEYVTLDKTFYSFLFKQEVAATSVTSSFSSWSNSSTRTLLEI